MLSCGFYQKACLRFPRPQLANWDKAPLSFCNFFTLPPFPMQSQKFRCIRFLPDSDDLKSQIETSHRSLSSLPSLWSANLPITMHGFAYTFLSAQWSKALCKASTECPTKCVPSAAYCQPCASLGLISNVVVVTSRTVCTVEIRPSCQKLVRSRSSSRHTRFSHQKQKVFVWPLTKANINIYFMVNIFCIINGSWMNCWPKYVFVA